MTSDSTSRHAAGMAAVMLLCCVCVTHAGASADRECHDIDVPRMDAAGAINLLARQTGAKLLFPYELAQSRQANAVTGCYTLEESLDLLLEGSGLTSGLTDKGVLVISREGSDVPDDNQGKTGGDEMNSQTARKSIFAGIAAFWASMLPAPNAAAQDGIDAEPGAKTTLEEVVVTAQKRGAQVLQDVPISMSVMTGKQLDASSYQGINDAIADIGGVTLYDTAQGGGSRITIRGIAPAASIVSTSATTAYYLDNMPFGFSRTSIAPDANPFDLERVEVLKGPQGTLYGASSLGGVVRVLTHNANLDEFELKARADFSGTEGGGVNYRGDVAVNVPIIPGRLAVRGVIGYQNNDGWIDTPVENNTNDAEIQTYRIKIGAQPTENLRIDFTGWFSRDTRDNHDAGFDDHFQPKNIRGHIETDYDLYGLELEYDFNDSISVVSTSTYMDYNNEDLQQIVPGLPLEFDLSGVGAGVLNFITTRLPNEAFTQEIRLHSHTDGPWNWSLGGFYRYDEDISERSGVIGVFSDVSTSEQTAVFGELTRSFFDGKAELTAGLRYFNDDLKLKSIISNMILGPRETLLRTVGVDNFDRVDSDSFDKLTYRAVLTGYPNKDLTVYASFSRGFRSGFIQRQVVLEQDPDFPNVKPDVLDNFELGAKGTAANGRVSYDVALYYLDWQDTQQSLLIRPPGGAGIDFTTSTNAGDASGFGVDASFDITVTDNLSVHGGVGWNDLTFDQDVQGASGIQFAKGSRIDQSAEWTANARVDYRFPIGGSGYEGLFSGSMSYNSPLNQRDQMGQFVSRIDRILLSNINFTVTPPSKKLSFTFYVNNLNNNDPIVAALQPDLPEVDSRLRPRTFGLRASYQY